MQRWDPPSEQVRSALEEVRDRIASAARRAGRKPEEVRLVAVTKQFGDATVRLLAERGVTDFGENRVVQGLERLAAFPALTWHLVGHLQRNKARRALAFSWIHSVDSVALIERLERLAEATEHLPRLLIQFNVAREPQKHGFLEEQWAEAASAARRCRRLRFVGLMCMAPLTRDPEEVRWVFARARELRDRLRGELGADFAHLSMGMSGDFEVAVEEGATLVRLGRVLSGRPPAKPE